jgi:HPt (histidine-containing phosphotransfer) domain-containing protein
VAANDAIRVKLDPRLATLFPRFLANCRKSVEAIRALGAGDLETARVIGHSLRGAGGFYNLHEVTEMGREIERAARAGEAREVAELAERLDRYLARVRPDFE